MNLKESILKTITWFDLFDFPLTAEEVMENLYDYRKPVHIKEVKGVLEEMSNIEDLLRNQKSEDRNLSLNPLVKPEEDRMRAEEENADIEKRVIPKSNSPLEKIKDYYVLRGRANIIEKRKTRKFIAEKLWSRTKLYGQYLRNVPFVRMIAVCNNLAYDNPSEQSDIDLFIVIQSGRMWLARLIISLILQFHGVRRHDDKIAGRFCLSFFVTEAKLNMSSLQIQPNDPYLAYWTKFLAPIYGEKTYDTFMLQNEQWLREKYGLKFPAYSKKHLYADNKNGSKKELEWIFGGILGDISERVLKKTFKQKTLKKMKSLSSKASVIVNDDMLKFHNKDRREEYFLEWQKKSDDYSIL